MKNMDEYNVLLGAFEQGDSMELWSSCQIFYCLHYASNVKSLNNTE